jgi:hypothetical protein
MSMIQKRPIDRKRDSGMSFEVGTAEEGATEAMVEIDDSLYIIKPKAIYALQTADQIDRDRTNIHLPKVVTRRVFAIGSESEIVGKTLLTAITLLDKGNFVRDGVDTRQVISTSLEALTMLVALQGIAAEFEAAEQAAYEKAAALRCAGDAAQQPYLGDVKSRCKSFMQQADHAVGTLLDIVRLFYPDIKKTPWDALREKIGREIGEDDQFAKFLDQAVPFFKLVRNARDCLEHKNTKGAMVKDFEVQPGGQLHPPTIEINFRESQHPTIAVSAFMSGTITSIANGFEMSLAHLCNANTRPSPAFPVYIDMPAGNRRRWKHVRFAFGTRFMGNDDFVPIG